MAPTELFARGLKWSYRKYGTKGALAFALLAVAGYYVATRRVNELFGGSSDEVSPAPDEADDAGSA